MPWNEGKKTFIAGAALGARRRVKLVAGTTTTPPQVEHAGAGEAYIGVTEYAAGAGEQVAVKLKNAEGTFEIECAVGTAIAVGTALHGAADGRVSDTVPVGSATQFIALEAGATNQHIECLPTSDAGGA